MQRGTRASKRLKEARKELDQTQLQLSMDTFLSRESITKQENGERKVIPSVANHFIEKYNNPWIAMEAANEYIGWGVTKLDGRAADLHRSSVKDKFLEELDEAIKSVKRVKTSVNPKMVQGFEHQDIERSVQETMDIVEAGVTWIAVACEEYGLSWSEQWDKHRKKLLSREYAAK